jgi:hypothetical protein
MSTGTAIHPVQAAQARALRAESARLNPGGVPLMATTYPWVSPTGELSAVSGGIEWAIPGTAGNVAVSTGVIPMGLVSVDVSGGASQGASG